VMNWRLSDENKVYTFLLFHIAHYVGLHLKIQWKLKWGEKMDIGPTMEEIYVHF